MSDYSTSFEDEAMFFTEPRPHKCEICDGIGRVNPVFKNTPFGKLADSPGKKCGRCKGTGEVWY